MNNPSLPTLLFALGMASGSFLVAPCEEAAAKTFYLDGDLATGCPAGNYSAATRACNGTDGIAYKTLAEAVANLAAGDTLYLRAGTYIRNGGSEFIGALSVQVSGLDNGHRTTVSAYPGEELRAVIGTDPEKLRYNPDPGQGKGEKVNLSAEFYPCPAISINASYVTVRGLKTYGQLLFQGGTGQPKFVHDITVENCDIGGGGPRLHQGQTVMLLNCRNTTIRNSRIHNSCRATDGGPGDANGAALMGYAFSATIENNEFYDNWSHDIRLKDTKDQYGNTIVIRNNFFRKSTLFRNAGVGIGLGNQYMHADHIYIHNNLFLEKNTGIGWDGTAMKDTVAYSNTFVNCDRDVFEWYPNNQIKIYNNLSHHTRSGQYHLYIEPNSFPLSNLASDYNLFDSRPAATWRHGTKSAGTLAGWKSYSGKDGHSVSKGAEFLNPNGKRPADFKRRSYAGDVSGSPYGTVCRAYRTGEEEIGVVGKGF
jgi:hypothetical protein